MNAPPTLRTLSLLALGAAAVVATAFGQKPPTRPATPNRERFAEVIEFPRQTLVLAPTRDDITVGRVLFSVFFTNREAVRVNGAKPTSAFTYIELKQVATNQFELAPLRIEVSTNQQSSPLCISVKAFFNEVSTQYDSMYYQKVDDRYALVAYCTSPPTSSEARSRFKQNRVATVNEFKQALSRPLAIKLNQRALRKEWAP